MRQAIRSFMIFEAATFFVASLIHAGVLIAGYEHHEALIAESVIALVLLGGVALTWIWPAWTRQAGLAAQAFALLGTLMGLFFIAIGLGRARYPTSFTTLPSLPCWFGACSLPSALRMTMRNGGYDFWSFAQARSGRVLAGV